MPIFDQGYQHWKGPLSGHGWRWLVVARHGVRGVIKGRIVRFMLFGAWVPALLLVTVLILWGLLEQKADAVLRFLSQMLPSELVSRPQEYRSAVWTIAYSFFFKAELAASLFLVMIVGPSLISRDLRFNALPLYFSRPLRRFDYFMGKLGVIGFFLVATVIGPAVVAYLLGVAFSLDVRVVRDTHRLLWAGVLYGLVITVSTGALMLALSSLTRRSIYVGLAWVAFCFISLMVSSILIEVRINTERHHSIRDGIRQWAEDNPPPEEVRWAGPYPIPRSRPTPPGRPPRPGTNEEYVRWYGLWDQEYRRLNELAETEQHEMGRTDWRPVCSYATNLDRIGDWLLDADSAWVVIGRAVERPRAAFGPALHMKTGGELGPGLAQPANDRFLADRMVWQYPWYWSAAALGTLLLVSVGILTSRVKSLDRLK